MITVNSDPYKLWGDNYMPPGPQPAPTPDEPKNYLAFEALENGTFSFTFSEDVSGEQILSEISFSLDNGANWTTEQFTQGTEKTITTPLINAGDKVLWKANGFTGSEWYGCVFSSTSNYNISGNIMSLIYGDDFEDKNFDENIDALNFAGLFGYTNVVSAGDLVLPNNVISGVYTNMFNGCESLTTAPDLPATTLEIMCYQNMFNGCKSLTTAPDLIAETLVESCYYGMFSGCESLNYIKALFLTDPMEAGDNQALEVWIDGIATTGTFVYNPNAEWTQEEDWQYNYYTLPDPENWKYVAAE